MSCKHYKSRNPCFFPNKAGKTMNTITLVYPNLNEEFIYLDSYGVNEIMATVHNVLKYCVLMTPMMRYKFFKDVEYIKWQLGIAKITKNFELFNNAVLTFNQRLQDAHKIQLVVGVSSFEKPDSFRDEYHIYQELFDHSLSTHPALIEHIYDQAYKRVVDPKAKRLSNYKAFSDNVYGEVNFIFIEKMLKELPIGRDSVFVDLGCGIGNVLCQVAGLAKCQCYGIEMLEETADLGLDLKREFMKRMANYSQYCGYIQLFKGNIADHQGMFEILKKATIVFVNNYVFTPELDFILHQQFWNLRDDCKIISLKSFVRLRKDTRSTPLEMRLNSRSVNHLESILHVEGI
eukprot:NODE_162_length_14959_cov_1.379610.p6 type:complete len:346 gc:universal NODE_162_length_14959_cov_1.379610:9444-8407(-)